MNVLSELDTTWAGKTCLCYEQIPSTQEEGKILAAKQNVHGYLLIAEEQTAGKGRRGRSWESPKGKNIAMSLCLEPQISINHVAGLTLVMALAAAKAIKKVTGICPQIKWPNDLVINGKKICGILTEFFAKPEGYAVIVGVGINVNTEEFPEEIRDTASSLKKENGKEISREQLILAVMKQFEADYEAYTQTEDMSLLKEEYESLLVNCERKVMVLDPKGTYGGTAKGITPEGNLIVLREDGTEISVSSGEVSVRGVYGYV